jgi:hypothetical protein
MEEQVNKYDELSSHFQTMLVDNMAFYGIKFTIQTKVGDEVIKESTKTINVIQAMALVEDLKNQLHVVAAHAQIYNNYKDYGEKLRNIWTKQKNNLINTVSIIVLAAILLFS